MGSDPLAALILLERGANIVSERKKNNVHQKTRIRIVFDNNEWKFEETCI